MELRADDGRVFMAFSLIFLILAVLSTQRLGHGSQSVPCEKHEYDDPKSLKMDTALVMLISNMKSPVNVFGVSSNCHKCGPQLIKENLTMSRGCNITVETNFPFTLAVNNSIKGTTVCSPTKYSLREHGFYSYNIHAVSENAACVLLTKDEPDSAYLPLLYAFLAILGAAILWNVLLYLLRRYNLLVNWELFHDTESLINADLGSPTFNGPASPVDDDDMPEKQIKKQRLKSLDTFRGIALTIMIFVNYGGGGYYFFKHARWNGLTVADLVFPWYVGICMHSVGTIHLE